MYLPDAFRGRLRTMSKRSSGYHMCSTGLRIDGIRIKQIGCVAQSRAHIGVGDPVFLRDFSDGHAASKPAHDPGHWHTRAANHRLAVLNARVNHNAIIHLVRLFWHDSLEGFNRRLHDFLESPIMENCDALCHQAFVGREQFGGTRETDVG